MKPRGRGVSPAGSVAAPLLNEENEFGGAEVSEVSHHSAGGESGKRVRQSVAAIRISRSRQVIAFGAGRGGGGGGGGSDPALFSRILGETSARRRARKTVGPISAGEEGDKSGGAGRFASSIWRMLPPPPRLVVSGTARTP